MLVPKSMRLGNVGRNIVFQIESVFLDEYLIDD